MCMIPDCTRKPFDYYVRDTISERKPIAEKMGGDAVAMGYEGPPRCFSDELISIIRSAEMEFQGHMYDVYQGDSYQSHRLQEGINIPAVQGFLKERP